jgi:peptidoglycan/LPS O-acetylase OafA/YrhL
MPSAAPIIGPASASAPPRLRAGRLDVLDGLRGWCALCVVLFHVFWEIFGVLVPEFRNLVTGFLFDGQLAVCIFFVLSGEALSTGFFAGKGDAATIRLAIKRYPRLTTPILAACLVVFTLDRSGMVFSHGAAALVHRDQWMGGWLQFPLTFSYTLHYSIYDVFVSENFGRAVNPMLWTMRVELLGSFLVFAILLLWRQLSRPRTVLLGLFIVAMLAPTGSPANYLSCFFAGVAFADWRARGVIDALAARFAWAGPTAIGLAAAADGARHDLGFEQGKTALAIVLTLAVYATPPLAAFFSSRLSRALGRISFPLYLIQFPVLTSVTSWLIVQAGAGGSLSLSAVWAISLVSVAACMLAAIAFAPVETLAQWLGEALVALVGRAVGGRLGGSARRERQPNRKAEIVLPPIASRKLCAPVAPSAAPTTTISGSRCSSRG